MRSTALPPRTQSALLEAMEERQVTIDGTSHILSNSFAVFATQNPVEFEGTYPLPEAQLDRFLMKIRVGYPEQAKKPKSSRNITAGFDARSFDRVGIESVPEQALQTAREETSRIRVEPKLLDYIVGIARTTRNSSAVSLGASPRAAIAMMLVAKAIAAIERARLHDSRRCEDRRAARVAPSHVAQTRSRPRRHHARSGNRRNPRGHGRPTIAP